MTITTSAIRHYTLHYIHYIPYKAQWCVVGVLPVCMLLPPWVPHLEILPVVFHGFSTFSDTGAPSYTTYTVQNDHYHQCQALQPPVRPIHSIQGTVVCIWCVTSLYAITALDSTLAACLPCQSTVSTPPMAIHSYPAHCMLRVHAHSAMWLAFRFARCYPPS